MSYDIEIKASDMGVDERLQDYVTAKAERLDRYINDIQKVTIELRHVKTARQAMDRFISQITMQIKGKVLRAEERTDDIYTAYDSALDKLQRRIEKFKGKRNRGRGDGTSLAEAALENISYDEEESDEPVIVRRKKFTLIPMDEREAIEQMSLLGHEDFFVFYNVNTATVNVLYRRRDNNFGLIETVVG